MPTFLEIWKSATSCSCSFSIFGPKTGLNRALKHYLYHNKKLWPFFRHALGAIDGSHIHFSPPVFYQAAYQNRKEFLSQNCLFACSFDLKFTYALTGWEGSAADAHIYHDAVNTDLVIPDGWYYLGDAGFPHCNQLLVPFRGVRYHLAEWRRSTTR